MPTEPSRAPSSGDLHVLYIGDSPRATPYLFRLVLVTHVAQVSAAQPSHSLRDGPVGIHGGRENYPGANNNYFIGYISSR